MLISMYILNTRIESELDQLSIQQNNKKPYKTIGTFIQLKDVVLRYIMFQFGSYFYQ